jgi:type III restriction enzyme
MLLKEFQKRALSEIKNYLELLIIWRKRAQENPELEIDFPLKAWEKAGIRRPYISRKNGIGQPFPNYCLKTPTGGGKTFLAVKIIDLVSMIYRRKRTGLVLWIVPTTQIYRQTIQSLKNRDHPYRQHLDLASGGRTRVLEKTDRFTPQDLQENLVVFMLMLPSANRITKETLRVFKDSGGFQDFFPGEDDIKCQTDILHKFPNLDTYAKESGIWGRQIKTSLGNTLRMLAPLIILDEGHKAYSEGAQATLRGFNPCMILELSATPAQGSNILVDITGKEVHREEMIKLDLHVINKASPDWRDTLLAGHNMRNALEQKAKDYEGNTGNYIRPICLIQAERTGSDQRSGKYIHSEDIRERLTKVMGIPADEVAVKTSEKDELKEVDDIGGLMSRECNIRYIITKQALQEGWDCAFAYVLVILTNPSSKNALTQLVGRILRQPFARKTGTKQLDESYVYCFQQRANLLLESIRKGFEAEGLGDLRGQIVPDEGLKQEGKDKVIGIRDKFKKAARRTVLPVFVAKDKSGWRPVNYEMDIAAKIPWNETNLERISNLVLSETEEKDTEQVTSLSDDTHEVIKQKAVVQIREGAIVVDPVFMTQQFGDIVPNPWQAHEFASVILSKLRAKNDEKLIINNFVFIIEEMKNHLEKEKDRLAEGVFLTMLKNGDMRFYVFGRDIHFKFPERMVIRPGTRRLNRKDGSAIQLNLFEIVPEEDFNETEKSVAWYLEDQKKLFFWFRNRARRDYSIQGWRPQRIYPDFILTSKVKEVTSDFGRIYVIETKGLHIKDNDKTSYIRKVFDLCNKQSKTIGWGELGLKFEENALKYEVLAEDEWEAELNKMLREST